MIWGGFRKISDEGRIRPDKGDWNAPDMSAEARRWWLAPRGRDDGGRRDEPPAPKLCSGVLFRLDDMMREGSGETQIVNVG